ncbi:sulfite exporter TauE/SafE family protein [Maridesulfovibrio ferrireducens]|uniref:sulfite exporter TauE/SafE family protein n=1 Tax=Maridesulfovibrio ferrireducens TaxID=246191 RepID=UPI001A2D4D8B|nr:sulfite exporter TauE/SafE family protein [Maridesulfovibrio ferrireducens]MBI9111124.1 sulfite exporter TauE/SafE family protein [Maridesulfovibrio ferrireducens]
MYFPVAGIEVNPLVPPLVAFVVSFFTSMGGVSGAFLLMPFQMSFLGYTSPSVSATNQLFNIVAIPSGVLRYIREGRMVWPLTIVVIVGTLPGVLVGAIVRVKWLPDPTAFKLFASAVLLWIGVKLALSILKKNKSPNKDAEEKFQQLVKDHSKRNDEGEKLPTVRVLKFSATRISYEFYGEVYDCSSIGLLSLSLIVGIVGGIYGIGGGSIIAPFFVTIFGLPVYTVAGAALMGTFVTSVAGVLFYQAIAPLYPNMAIAPDWTLGILFGIGGMAGMYFGARCQKFFPAKIIKWMLTVIILFTAGKYISEFFLK